MTRHGIAEVIRSKLAGEDGDLGELAQQPTPLIRRKVLAQGVLPHPYVRGNRGQQGRRVSSLV